MIPALVRTHSSFLGGDSDKGVARSQVGSNRGSHAIRTAHYSYSLGAQHTPIAEAIKAIEKGDDGRIS